METQASPEVLTLEPGGVVVGIDGVTIFADELYFSSHLEEAMQFTMERYDEALAELPMREGYIVKSHVYRLSIPASSENKLYNFVIGVPVLKGANFERLREATLANTANWTDTFPPYRSLWLPSKEFYDKDNNLYKSRVLLRATPYKGDNHTFVLVEHTFPTKSETSSSQ